MYRKIVWCYIIVLTLLDLSLNTKLSAQGKSHGNGISVHESLMEGISLQEWGKESSAEGGTGAGGRGRLALAPVTLEFGRRALAAAHALHVTITNTANETVHLASVAGTTPDFHASFFESKTLAPQANTTFSVVYLGRREGPVAAHLYIHTSKGVHKYPVSAVGVASEWRVWPLVGLRVPLNATLEPLLTLYNPTDTTIQVSEVYSSGAWLGLALPGLEGAAPRALWSLPPHSARPLVRLRLQPPPHLQAPLTAYIRIKGNMTGGGLVVGVEATPAPAGEFLRPLQLRLRTRGSRDPPDTLFVEAGSSDAEPARLHVHAGGACGPGAAGAAGAGGDEPPALDKLTHNGVKADASGVTVTLLRNQLEPHQELTRTAEVTLDYGKMWAGYEASLSNGGGGGGTGGAREAYCGGWLRVGRAALPYSLRVLPGTLALHPTELHFVTCNKEEALKPQEVVARNDFPEPIRITYVDFPPEVQQLFHTESLAPLELGAGGAGAVCRLRLRGAATSTTLQAHLTLHTNLSDYSLPLLLYEGTLRIEWEWPGSADGTLRLGALGTSSTRVVAARLHNAGPAPLCVTSLTAVAAHFHLHDDDRKGCVAGGGSLRAWLRVLAPAAEGALEGAAHAHTAHGASAASVLLTARAGRLRALPVLLPPAAPYVASVAPLELESSMSVRMRVVGVTHAASPDPALSYLPETETETEGETETETEGGGQGEVRAGRGAVGRLQYAPELHCQPHCYTGLQLDTPEGAAWAARGQQADALALQLDAQLQRVRYAMFTPTTTNFTLHLHTTEVVQVPVTGTVSLQWPRVWALGSGGAGGAGGAGGSVRAGLVGVGASLPLRLRAANPSRHRTLLLQPRLAVHPLDLGGAAGEACVGCVWSAPSFQLGAWRVTRGVARPFPAPPAPPLPGGEPPAPYLLLQPLAELEFTVTFAPTEPADLAAYLYLRNNLTIVERVLVTGRGALPAFELGGRAPNSSEPLVLEVAECGAAAEAAGGAVRALRVRNTGRVALRLRSWRVAGVACAGRGFRVQPCAALRLAPQESRTIHLHFAADWTRSNTQATLTVAVGGGVARFPLAGLAPARLLALCAPAARAPREPELRALALALAALALLGAAGLGAADAERALRRHRGAREAQAPRAPLDLRALARAEPPPPPARPAPPAPRRRRTPRARPAPAPDAAAERRAFERWRAGGAAAPAPPGDDSRSSEEDERDAPPPAPPLAPPAPRGDASSSSPDSSPPPPARDSYSSLSRRAEDDEGASSGTDSSSPGEGRAPPPRTPPAGAAQAQAHAHSRGSRQRRESAEARRSERKSAEATLADNSSNGGAVGAGAGARAPSRGHTRKERTARRRGERAPSPAPRAASPRACPAPAPPPAPAGTALRWRAGASWSDVVSRGHAAAAYEGGGAVGAAAPLAPIGSDVRRRLGSHSLFYYGGAPAWPPAPPAAPAVATPPPPPPAPIPTPEEGVASGYRSLESLWGSSVEPLAPGAAWLWGGGAGGAGVAAPPAADPVRPPPGFSAPRPVRPYDPFQSLASIWTPAALDWRLDSGTPPPAPPVTPPLADDKFDPAAGN